MAEPLWVLLVAGSLLAGGWVCHLLLVVPARNARLVKDREEWRRTQRMCEWCSTTATCITHVSKCCKACCSIHHGWTANCEPLCQRCFLFPIVGRGTMCVRCGI